MVGPLRLRWTKDFSPEVTPKADSSASGEHEEGGKNSTKTKKLVRLRRIRRGLIIKES